MRAFSTHGTTSGPSRTAAAAVALAVGSLGPSSGLDAHERSLAPTSPDVASAAPSPGAWPPLSTRAAPRPLGPASGGAWSEVSDWPLVAVHAALLPDGRVLAWDATPDDSDADPHTAESVTTRTTLWNPVDDTHVASYNDTGTDLFCAGSAHLWDGQMLFAGGDAGRGGTYAPVSHGNLYDPASDIWRRVGNLRASRWYSSVTALANGEMLTWGGGYRPRPAGEVFRLDRTWRSLSSAVMENDAPNADYQWIQQVPDGSVLWFGPGNRLASIDTSDTGRWTVRGPRDGIDLRDYGSHAHFDVGRILVAGGGDSSASAIVIDAGTRQASDTSPMNIGRKQHMLTVLADGSVLATGGNRDAQRFYSPEGGVREPEIWDPASGRWTLANPMSVDRQYHSIALLLPDGRVLSAGGGLCAVCYEEGYEEANAEIFSPPYLFGDDGLPAPRPRLSGVPATADYGAVTSVTSDDAGDVERAHLIKLGSATHSQNQDQRLVPLTVGRDGTTLRLGMPVSRAVAPPGHYLLFVVDRQGVPSHGAVLRLGQPSVAPGQEVRGRLSAEGGDSYAVPAVPIGALSIGVASADDVGLTLSANASSGDAGDVRCRIGRRAPSPERCVVDGAGVERWLVTLEGDAGSEYTLRIDAVAGATDVDGSGAGSPDAPSGGSEDEGAPAVVPDTNAPTSADGDPGGSGGGAPSASFLLLLLPFSLRRLPYRHAPSARVARRGPLSAANPSTG